MPNRPLKIHKLRTIIRLYTDRVGLRAISELARTSSNTVKKYVGKWHTLNLSYERVYCQERCRALRVVLRDRSARCAQSSDGCPGGYTALRLQGDVPQGYDRAEAVGALIYPFIPTVTASHSSV